MKIIRTIKSWFQRDTHSKIENNFTQHKIAEYKIPNDEMLLEIANRLSMLPIHHKSSFSDYNLLKGNCLKFDSIDTFVLKAKEIIERDQLEIDRNATENGYTYLYKIGELDIFPDAIVITNTLDYLNSDRIGEVIYNLLTMIKGIDYYCLWDLTED